MSDFLMKLLNSRERRYELQRNLVEIYRMPIISFMLNIPGSEKRNDKYIQFHKMGVETIERALGEKILFSQYFDEDTGMYYLAAVDMEPVELKVEMMKLEDSDEGRLFDIDVFDEELKQITRNSLNLQPRKCLLCDNVARICIRNSTHSYEELIAITDKIVNSSISD